jgi:hypothetical protein
MDQCLDQTFFWTATVLEAKLAGARNPCPWESRRLKTALNLFQILTELKCRCTGWTATDR